MINKPNLKKTACFNLAIISALSATTLLAALTPIATAHAQTADYIIATVDETPILHSDLVAATVNAKKLLGNKNAAIPSDKTLQAQVLDRLITRTTQLNIINRLGDRISNEAINESIRTVAAKQGIGSLSEFQIMLEDKQPGSYAALHKQIREELTIQQLKQQELRKRVNITDQDIDYFLLSPESQQLHQTEYHTSHIRIGLPEKTANKAQREEALRIAQKIKRAFDAGNSVETIVANVRGTTDLPVQGGDMGFHSDDSLPTYLRNQIIQLKVGETAEPLAYTDGIHIVNLLDKKDASESIVHQWNVRHILIKPNEIMNISQAKQNIDDIYEKLEGNADFSVLATTYSDDPGSARKGGSLDWVVAGQMVPEFDAMMQNIPIGSYSKPFQTQFGWHILKVEGERDKNMSEQFKRKVARDTLYKRMSSQAIEDWMQELRANSYINIIDPRFKS